MADFPGILNNPTRLTVSTYGAHSMATEQAFLTGLSGSTSATWPASNRALYMPVIIETTVTAFQMGVIVTTTSGNLDVGIYDQQLKRLVSMGSTAMGGSGTFQAFNIADTLLTPGIYYLAMCVDNTTASFPRTALGIEHCRANGIQQQAVGAVTLPDPMVPANPASAYFPALMLSAVVTL